MPANNSPIFTLTPIIGAKRLTGAQAARDLSATTNSVSLLTGGTNGTRVDTITFTNSFPGISLASTANVGRVYVFDGTNYRLQNEVAIATATPSSSAIGGVQTITYVGGLVLPSGYSIVASIATWTSDRDNYDVIARGGDY